MPKPNPLVRASAADDDDDNNDASGATPGWLTKGKKNIKQQQEANKAASGGDFLPEFWLKSGERAVIRIPSKVSALEISVARHNIPVRTKWGRRFRQFTCTGDSDSCAGCAAGLKASIRWPLILLDHREMEYNDYNPETKQKTKVKRSKVAKLWMPSVQELDNLMAAIEDYKQDKGKEITDLTNYLVRVRRTGEKAKTSYSFTIAGRSEMEEKETKRMESFKKKYGSLEDMLKPIPVSAQKKLMGAQMEEEEESEAEVSETTDTDVD